MSGDFKFPPMPTRLGPEVGPSFMGKPLPTEVVDRISFTAVCLEMTNRGLALKKLVELYDEFTDPKDFAACVGEHIEHWRAMVENIDASSPSGSGEGAPK